MTWISKLSVRTQVALVALVAVLFICALFVFMGRVFVTRVTVCTYCGRFLEEEWVVGLKRAERVTESDFSAWADMHVGKDHVHSWHIVSILSSNAFRRLNSCGSGNGHRYLNCLSIVHEMGLDEHRTRSAIEAIGAASSVEIDGIFDRLLEGEPASLGQEPTQ